MTGFDTVVEILPHEVGVLAGGSLCFFPYETGSTLHGGPVKLDQLRRSVLFDETIGMDTEPIDVAKRTGNPVACHCPKQSVQGTRLLTEEIVGSIVGSRRLWNFIGWLWLDGMNQIGEQDSILDKKDRNIVPDDICCAFVSNNTLVGKSGLGIQDSTVISLVSIETNCEAVDITRRVDAAPAASNS